VSKFEPVLMTWDYYDGPRTGVAEYNGHPHFYKCIWDAEIGNYSDNFELSPIGNALLQSAIAQWKIFRAWELQFHTGKVTNDTHPGHRGNNLEYDRLEDELKTGIEKLTNLPDIFTPTFRALPKPNHLPKYVMADLEVSWLQIN